MKMHLSNEQDTLVRQLITKARLVSKNYTFLYQRMLHDQHIPYQDLQQPLLEDLCNQLEKALGDKENPEYKTKLKQIVINFE